MSRTTGPRPSVPLRLTAGDAVVALAVLGLALAQVLARPAPEGPVEAVVTASGQQVGRYDLRVPRRLRIAGPLGITEVAIGDGGARIAASPCPHQLCVRRGRLERAGQLAACVPNRVLVEIAGRRRPGALDGVSR